MNGTSKRNLHIGIVYACLLLATAVVSHLNAPGLPAPLFVGLGMSRSCLHAAMLAFWLYSVRRRVPDVLPRRLLSASAGLLILWIALKATKYYLCDSVAIDRYLWYLYYLPILFVPLLFLLIAMSLNKPEDFRLPRWTLLPSAAAALLFLLVLTNDLHQFVFVFPADAAVLSDENYAYGPGYFLAAGWAVLCAAAAFALMIRKCRLAARRVLWVPLIPLGTAILYSVLYGAGSPIVWRTVPDLSVFLGFCLAAVLECCIGSGLIRSNTHY
ncbi:MAG: hypothetical protein K5981_01090, partial [Clostridia bacterium]|nr:hypothetical protein [Clostridia bacterium]